MTDRIARGNQFLLPTEDSIVVSEALAERYGLPKWQYTVSASQANTEAIRVARVATGRDKVLLFDGHYLGHFDQTLVEVGRDGAVVPEELVCPPRSSRARCWCRSTTRCACSAPSSARDIALVLTEPALTNNLGLILPRPGYHDGLRALTRETGTLLAIDETHTQVVGPAG